MCMYLCVYNKNPYPAGFLLNLLVSMEYILHGFKKAGFFFICFLLIEKLIISSSLCVQAHSKVSRNLLSVSVLFLFFFLFFLLLFLLFLFFSFFSLFVHFSFFFFFFSFFFFSFFSFFLWNFFFCFCVATAGPLKSQKTKWLFSTARVTALGHRTEHFRIWQLHKSKLTMLISPS